MRPRVFIGSSVESLPLARAIQTELAYDFEMTIWSQGIFKLSSTALQDLEAALAGFDFGIFVFQPDDIVKIRNRRKKAVRDNVIFELGLFIGRLGKDRIFFLVPESSDDLHLPSDLLGILPGKYFERSDGNLRAAVGPFCDEVRERARESRTYSLGVKRVAMFQEFSFDFPGKLERSNELTAFFIHSRSWRENNHDAVARFLARHDTKGATVFLPNFLNVELMSQIAQNFEDGPVIPGLVEDAARFFARFRDSYPSKISVFLTDFYPTYSFYKFDTNALLALYPTTDKKKNVPTLEVVGGSDAWHFLVDDLKRLESTSTPLAAEHITRLSEIEDA